MARSARRACVMPKMALMTTMAKMAMPSPNRSKNDEPGSGRNAPNPMAMAAAAISASTVKSVTCPHSLTHTDSGGSSGSLLGPTLAKRAAASARSSPRLRSVRQ